MPFIIIINLFTVGCAGSSLLCGGFSWWWLVLLQTTGSRHTSFPRPVESSQTRDQTCVPNIARQILNYWTTREVHEYLLEDSHDLYISLGSDPRRQRIKAQ